MNKKRNYATKSLYELVNYVFSHDLETMEGVTYQELAYQIGRRNKNGVGHGHGMGKVLGDMGHLLQEIEGDWGESIPHIQSLVVNKISPLKGLPDKGIEEFWPEYSSLSTEEKRNKVRAEYIRICDFGSRWNKVLVELGLEQVQKTPVSEPGRSRAFGAGGESPEHKALKEYVLTNPQFVGANRDDEAILEYAFPSLDAVDVMFKSSKKWVAVEVKSHVSDQIEKDYERGLYQCVKYQALLEAMKKDSRYQVPDKVNVILLLEKSLPGKYRNTARSLGVKVIEKVTVPETKNE